MKKILKNFMLNVKDIPLLIPYQPITIEKLLGAMISNNINNGIIITTGTVSDDAKSILSKIEKPYNIKIISSKESRYSVY